MRAFFLRAHLVAVEVSKKYAPRDRHFLALSAILSGFAGAAQGGRMPAWLFHVPGQTAHVILEIGALEKIVQRF